MIRIKPIYYSELSLRGENPRGPRVGMGDQQRTGSHR